MSARNRVFGVLVLASMAFAAPATASQQATPAVPDNCTAVAEGLDAPREIAVGGDGTVYVVDGAEGAGRVATIAPDGTVNAVAEGLPLAAGDTVPSGLALDAQGQAHVVLADGSVARVLEDGTTEPVVTGLTGVSDIAFDADGKLLVAAGNQLLRCDVAVEFAAATEVTISMQDVFFEPNEVTIPANTDVTLHIVNDGFAFHNLSIPAAGIATPQLGNGGTHDLVVNLPPGDYEIVCDVRGHKSAGMVGTLHVSG